MTTTDPGVEAAAAAIWTQMRAMTIAGADAAKLDVVRRVLPEDFEDLDERRQNQHRALARAAVDAWRLYTDLGPTS